MGIGRWCVYLWDLYRTKTAWFCTDLNGIRPQLFCQYTECPLNSCYHSYQWFWHIKEAIVSFSHSLVYLQLQTKEVLPAGSTIITAILSGQTTLEEALWLYWGQHDRATRFVGSWKTSKWIILPASLVACGSSTKGQHSHSEMVCAWKDNHKNRHFERNTTYPTIMKYPLPLPTRWGLRKTLLPTPGVATWFGEILTHFHRTIYEVNIRAQTYANLAAFGFFSRSSLIPDRGGWAA